MVINSKKSQNFLSGCLYPWTGRLRVAGLLALVSIIWLWCYSSGAAAARINPSGKAGPEPGNDGGKAALQPNEALQVRSWPQPTELLVKTRVASAGGQSSLSGGSSKEKGIVGSKVRSNQQAGIPPQTLPGGTVAAMAQPRWWRVKVPEDMDLAEAQAAYRNLPDVEAVQPNYWYRATSFPNDPLYVAGRQWNLDQVNAGTAWQRTTGSPVVVAVADTGVDLNHPDLLPNLVEGFNAVNPGHLPQDDSSLGGYYGHGTVVAGIIGAAINNGIGVAGLAGGVRLMPIKVLDNEGWGDSADIATGIAWAAANGARVINLSLGGSVPGGELDGGDLLMAEAIEYARRQAGSVVVASAGNDGNGYVSFPASLPGVIAVGATDSANMVAGFSNRGIALDLVAPGVGILSTTWEPGHSGYGGDNSLDMNHYNQGTSFSAPHVAAMAALVLSAFPSYTPDQVESVLELAAHDLGGAGWDRNYGYGQIDAAAAIQGRLPPIDEREPDGPDQAVNLVIGATGTGTLSPAGDEDWFKITATADTELYASIMPPPELDGVVDVYDVAPGENLSGSFPGTPVTTIDYWGEGIADTGGWIARTGHTYYLEVKEFTGRWSVTPYTIQVSQRLGDAREPDNNVQDAKMLLPGTIRGTLFPTWDHDVYKLEATGSGLLEASIEPPAELDVCLRLSDAAGQSLSTVDIGLDGDSESLTYNLTRNGVYYLEVWEYWEADSASPYNLTINYPGQHQTGDLDSDGDVDIFDLALLAKYWGGVRPAGSLGGIFDLSKDGNISLKDLVLLGGHYGKKIAGH